MRIEHRAWHDWFPGREPGKIGYDELYRTAARKAFEEVGVKEVTWMPTGQVFRHEDGRELHGMAWPSKRKVQVPIPTTIDELATALHEAGHVAVDNRDEPFLEREAAASTWALKWWSAKGLPDIQQAAFSLERSYRADERREREAERRAAQS